MNKTVYSIGYILIISVFFATLVSSVKLANEDRIERNEQVKFQQTIFKVLGIVLKESLQDHEINRIFDERIEKIVYNNREFYIAYEEDGSSIRGYAFPVEGPGFWGVIRAMVAVNSDGSEIIGISFYEHSETPGLGARISEDWFTEQFSGLPIHTIEGDNSIFTLSPERPDKKYNELDAVTGASRTSDAVESFLNNELDLFLREYWESVQKGKV